MTERSIKTAVVTGPTGAIGTALCEVLAARGVTVYAVLRPDSPRLAALPEHERVHPVFCDLSALSSLTLPEGARADAFFHLAWAHTTGEGRNNMPAQLDNVRYALDALEAAHRLGASVFVGAGSQAEYGRVEGALSASTPTYPENGYGIAKLCAGQMTRTQAERYGIDHIWVRILSVYGPRDGESSLISTLIRTLLNGEEPMVTAGEQKWDYLYSYDAAEALCLLAERGIHKKTYVLGGGTARPLRDYMERVRDAIDPALSIGFGKRPYAPLQVMHLEADIGSLTEDTGFVPRVSFEEGIRHTVASMKNKKGNG